MGALNQWIGAGHPLARRHQLIAVFALLNEGVSQLEPTVLTQGRQHDLERIGQAGRLIGGCRHLALSGGQSCMVALLSCQPAQRQGGHHFVSQLGQDVELALIRGRPWGVINGAQRADGHALRRDQGDAHIKAQARRACHQRVVGKAWVGRGVGHDQGRHVVHRVAAKRDVAWCLWRLESDARFEPLTVGIDQGDQHGGHPHHVLSHLSQAVKSRFWRGVEHLVGLQCSKPFRLMAWDRCAKHVDDEPGSVFGGNHITHLGEGE